MEAWGDGKRAASDADRVPAGELRFDETLFSLRKLTCSRLTCFRVKWRRIQKKIRASDDVCTAADDSLPKVEWLDNNPARQASRLPRQDLIDRCREQIPHRSLCKLLLRRVILSNILEVVTVHIRKGKIGITKVVC